jgi:predicted TIM-barrel fold metal-dependent hydrolase
MLFGSDWPMIAPEKWLAAFDKADFKDEVRPLILKENAMRLLGVPGLICNMFLPVFPLKHTSVQ